MNLRSSLLKFSRVKSNFNFKLLAPLLGVLLLGRNRRQAMDLDLVETHRERAIYIDVSRVSTGYDRGGIPRTVIEVVKAFTRLNCFRNVGFVKFGARGRILSAHEWAIESGVKGDFSLLRQIQFQPHDVLFSLDLSLPPDYFSAKTLRALREHGVSVYSVIYDLMPIDFPGFFKIGKSLLFWHWLREILLQSRVISISESVERRLQLLRKDLSLGVEKQSSVVRLASFETRHIPVFVPRSTGTPWRILMVGTIEPRKKYDEALNIFRQLWSEGLNFEVTILGKAGWKNRSTIRTIGQLQAKRYPLHWAKDASDEDLEKAYSRHDLLVANSVAEGFGLPILEAASRGLSVLARDIEVFREVLPNADFYESSPELLSKIRNIVVGSREAVVVPPSYPKGANRTWEDVARELCFLMSKVPDM